MTHVGGFYACFYISIRLVFEAVEIGECYGNLDFQPIFLSISKESIQPLKKKLFSFLQIPTFTVSMCASLKFGVQLSGTSGLFLQ